MSRAESDARSSAYITGEGYARLRAEYHDLWHVRRPEVVRALSAAAAEGDRSENAEYIYRKKELREIDRRVGYLQRRLADLRIVDGLPKDCSRIFFGAWVELVAGDGGRRTCRLVGPDEIDAQRGLVSIDSPLAKAMLGKKVSEWVWAQLPGGEAEYEVARVWYDSPTPSPSGS
jgi:transcription elongation factor GreB